MEDEVVDASGPRREQEALGFELGETAGFFELLLGEFNPLHVPGGIDAEDAAPSLVDADLDFNPEFPALCRTEIHPSVIGKSSSLDMAHDLWCGGSGTRDDLCPLHPARTRSREPLGNLQAGTIILILDDIQRIILVLGRPPRIAGENIHAFAIRRDRRFLFEACKGSEERFDLGADVGDASPRLLWNDPGSNAITRHGHFDGIAGLPRVFLRFAALG